MKQAIWMALFIGALIGALISIGAWAMSPHFSTIAMAMIGIAVGIIIGTMAAGRFMVWSLNQIGDDEKAKGYAIMSSIYLDVINIAQKYDNEAVINHFQKEWEFCQQHLQDKMEDPPQKDDDE